MSLLFQNSAMAPLTLVGDAPRYLREIDLVATVPTASDQGIQPLIDDSELASLDWTGAPVIPVIHPWLSSRMRRSTSGSIPSTTAWSGSRPWPRSPTVVCAT
ncbi:MAG TPA: hypothetical protein VNW71_10900 [Thermoanaerobaculia bacterium]|nr:hypothetical protein [Thermoanaerobaculia bacterium]